VALAIDLDIPTCINPPRFLHTARFRSRLYTRLDNPEIFDSYTIKEGSAGVEAVPKMAIYICCLGVQGQVN